MTPDRFFTLLLALRTRPTTTVAVLAEEAGASERTVIRDLHWLQDAGFPVLLRRGRYGGVSMLPGGALDTSRLTPGEREHLALAGLDRAQRERLGVEGVSDRALRKVAGTRSADGLVPIGEVVVSDNRPWFGPEAEGVSPAEIVGDLRRGVRLKVEYRRSDGTVRERTVDPYGLLVKGGRWYLVADMAGEPRLLGMQRIIRWEPLASRRRLRRGAGLAEVAAELTSGWEAQGDKVMRLRIKEDRVELAKRMIGMRLSLCGDGGSTGGVAGDGRPVEPGWVEAELRYRVADDVRQVLAFADSIEVVGPPEAREKAKELAERILGQYV
ncbi:helix-turn-helix transcriptional regulator [Salininema proteolyticum]|uniref:Helix-turn-helix transcriptional regulator n=1 Tax=Salininema proteolyticum TaxID=1607685 RepID=A0ABV8TXX1_9ACTN